jgi:hypothetical protein
MEECRSIFLEFLNRKRKMYIDDINAIAKQSRFEEITDENVDALIQWELGLNCKYGVELEFTHASLIHGERTTRFVLGNKINTCIVQSNPVEYYSYKFDPRHKTRTILKQQSIADRANRPSITPGKTTFSDFNQWTNFLTEVMSDYHAPTHVSLPFIGNSGKGMSGFKIEYDAGVLFNGFEYDGEEGEYVKADSYGVLNADRQDSKLTMWKSNRHSIDSSAIKIRSGDASINVVNVKDVLGKFENISVQTELVTPILVDEPFRIQGEYVPYGIIALENMISHMKKHDSVLFVQNDGLHIHISKNNKDAPLSEMEIQGFVKLFWLFEPLFLAGEPNYRAENTVPGYRSLQSIFNYDEIVVENSNDQYVYNVLTGMVNRMSVHPRYVSLNLVNLLPDQIGTFEYRIGHGTFDGKSIQLHTHLLQVLFQFNIALIESTSDLSRHNMILDLISSQGGVPDFTRQPYGPKGVSENCFNSDPVTNTRIVSTLARCFATLTGSVDAIDAFIDYIELYHCIPQTDPVIGFPDYIASNMVPFKTDWTKSKPANFVKFHYFTTPIKHCMTTYFNNGDPVKVRGYLRSDIPDLKDMDGQYLDLDNKNGKFQTELLDTKIRGGRKTKRKAKTKRKKHGGSAKIPERLTVATTEPVLMDHTRIPLNKYLDAYNLTKNPGIPDMPLYIISYPIKFEELSNVDVLLSTVVSNLITKNIITMKQLTILIKMKYIDAFLYLEESCFNDLTKKSVHTDKSFLTLNMTKDLFDDIVQEYKAVYNVLHYKTMVVNLDTLHETSNLKIYD